MWCYDISDQYSMKCFSCLFELETGIHLQRMAATTSTFETDIEGTPGILCENRIKTCFTKYILPFCVHVVFMKAKTLTRDDNLCLILFTPLIMNGTKCFLEFKSMLSSTPITNISLEEKITRCLWW